MCRAILPPPQITRNNKLRKHTLSVVVIGGGWMSQTSARQLDGGKRGESGVCVQEDRLIDED